MVSHSKNLDSFHDLVSSKYETNKQDPLSKQRGGTKTRNLASFRKVLLMLSGGEDVQMIQSHLKEGSDHNTQNLQVTLNMIQKYNQFGRTKKENEIKQHLLHCISSTLPFSKAKKLGLKVGSTNYIQSQNSNSQIKIRKVDVKREAHDSERKKKVVSFLHSNSRYAANKTAKINSEHVSVKYLNDSVISLFLQYNKSELSSFSVSESFFRSIIKKEKIFKDAKKETDKCSHCKVGKKSEKSLSKLLAKGDVTKLTLDEQETVKKLEKGVQIYHHHKDIASKQYGSFKWKKKLEVLEERDPSIALLF